jgi:hypothetical protein
MGRQVCPLIAVTLLLSVAVLGAQSSAPALPNWMKDFLPKTGDEKARATAFDSYGSEPLRLGIFSLTTSCGVFSPGTPARSYAEFVADLACAFDAIAVADPHPVATRLNNRGTFIFTEHAMPVDRWIHPSSDWVPEVDVLVAGGTLKVGGQSTGVDVGQSLDADRYLFFLKRVQGTKAFVIVGRALHPGMEWAQRLPSPPIPVELAENEVPFDRFIDDLANAALRCRKRLARLEPGTEPEPGTASAKRELRTWNREPGTAARSAARAKRENPVSNTPSRQNMSRLPILRSHENSYEARLRCPGLGPRLLFLTHP